MRLDYLLVIFFVIVISGILYLLRVEGVPSIKRSGGYLLFSSANFIAAVFWGWISPFNTDEILGFYKVDLATQIALLIAVLTLIMGLVGVCGFFFRKATKQKRTPIN